MVSNWGGKMGDGVNSYGEWWNVGLHKLSANLRVAQATLADMSRSAPFMGVTLAANDAEWRRVA